MSTERAPRTPYAGKGVCRWCGAAVPRGRRSWCGARCVDEYLDRTPGRLRQLVLERDRGVCAVCGRDCERLRERLERLLGRLRDRYRADSVRSWRCRRLFERLRVVDSGMWSARHLWEADHIVPVVEGGGGCGVDGMRTLCRVCHRHVTAELARRRAQSRRRASGR